MRTADELKKAVDSYIERKGEKMKKSNFSPFDLTYSVTTQDYTEYEAKIITDKSGRKRTIFKVDGKISSFNK
jgi:hypothetical protein